MPSMALTTLIKAAYVLALAQQVLGDCYRPDGTDRNIGPNVNPGEYKPCKNASGGHSMCCNTRFNDQCRSNGLCYNEGAKLLWRESCSDPTWKDPACIKLCAGANQLDAEGRPMSGIDSVITICGDNSLCCGSGDFAQRCCDANKGFLITNGAVVEAHPTPKTTAKPAPATTVTPEKETVTKTKEADPTPDRNNGGNDGGNNGGGEKSSSKKDVDSNTRANNNNGGSGASPTTSAEKERSTANADKEDSDGTNSEEGTDPKASSPADSSEDSNSKGGATPTGTTKGNQDSTKDDSDDTSDETDENDPATANPSQAPRPKKNGHGSSGDEADGGTESNGSPGKSSALIGGVVGGVLGGLILFVIAAWFLVRKRRAAGRSRSQYINTLGSSSELPGSEGRRFYEVPGDYKFPVVAQVPVTMAPVVQTKEGGELAVGEYGKTPDAYYEMQVASPVSR